MSKYEEVSVKTQKVMASWYKPSDDVAIEHFYLSNPSTDRVLRRIGPGTRGVVIASVRGGEFASAIGRIPKSSMTVVQQLDHALDRLADAIKARAGLSNYPDTAHTEELMRQADEVVADCENMVKKLSHRAGL